MLDQYSCLTYFAAKLVDAIHSHSLAHRNTGSMNITKNEHSKSLFALKSTSTHPHNSLTTSQAAHTRAHHIYPKPHSLTNFHIPLSVQIMLFTLAHANWHTAKIAKSPLEIKVSWCGFKFSGLESTNTKMRTISGQSEIKTGNTFHSHHIHMRYANP